MKKLYLVRHAKSSWDDPFQDDFDRPLNKRGRKDAPRMGRRLSEKDIHPDLLISSPAERALSTCLLIAERIGYPLTNIQTDQRLYHADEDILLSVVRGLHHRNDEIIIFSHNPGLTDFLNRITGELVTDNVPTCGVVAVGFPVEDWALIGWGSGKLLFFDFPKNV